MNKKCHFVDAREFVANASHELRTPITVIKGFSETLREMPQLQSCDLAPQILKEITGKIVTHCDRMETLIGRLLLLSKLDGQKEIEKKQTTICSATENAISQLLQRYPKAKINYSLQSKPLSTLGDSALLELAIFNILHNSVKYSTAPAEISILLEGEKLTISDKGVGIDEKEINRIFERFYKSGAKTKESSYGLGLSLVKTILDHHNATIQVKSTPGIGTSISMRFPEYIQSELPVT